MTERDQVVDVVLAMLEQAKARMVRAQLSPWAAVEQVELEVRREFGREDGFRSAVAVTR